MKRQYKYGQAYRCPKCGLTLEIWQVWDYNGRYPTTLEVRSALTRCLFIIKAEQLNTYVQEYTYSKEG